MSSEENLDATNGQDNWDVEQYRAEHECEEHWELKRKFLLTHRDKFPENELACLAQVFVNVEVLGCRYPKETMRKIAELSKDIVVDYRQKQQTRLQRTFVSASDAASSKVKGTTMSKSTSLDKKDSETSDAKPFKNPGYTTDTSISTKRRKLDEFPYGDLVMIERPGDPPQNVLAHAVNASGGSLEWKFDKINDNYKCIVFLNSKQLAEACGPNQKAAKKEASTNGVHELRKYYYTVKIKYHINEAASVTTSTMLKNNTTHNESISNDNIGAKLMKLMGWTGGGLGKSEQGITEPVTVKQQISKEGLGLKSNSCSTNHLRRLSRDLMRKYLAGEMQNDLVFSPDFSNDERAIVHQVARQLGLKSHSYGPKNQRTLVVCRKIDTRDLIEELISLGGVTDKYELISPTKM